MHIIIGALIIAGSFLLAFQYSEQEFSGFLNYYSLILLGGVPIGLAILISPFSTIAEAFKALGIALFGGAESEKTRIVDNLLSFGRSIRAERPAEAAAVLEAEPDPLFRHLGQQVLQQTSPEEIEIDALIVGRRELQHFDKGEKLFAVLGDFAPALGMLGTIIGLIHLLANMQDFEKLGPGMAIALLTTFYGLLLAHLLYLPLARLIGDRRVQRAETLNIIADTMLKIARQRPLHEIQKAAGKDLISGGNLGADGTRDRGRR